MAFNLPGNMMGAPFVESASVPYGYPRHEIKDPLRMLRPGYPGMSNEDRGNPFLTAQGRHNPTTGQLDLIREQDPGVELDREQQKPMFRPPLTPPQFRSTAHGGFKGLEHWLGKHGLPRTTNLTGMGY